MVRAQTKSQLSFSGHNCPQQISVVSIISEYKSHRTSGPAGTACATKLPGKQPSGQSSKAATKSQVQYVRKQNTHKTGGARSTLLAEVPGAQRPPSRRRSGPLQARGGLGGGCPAATAEPAPPAASDEPSRDCRPAGRTAPTSDGQTQHEDGHQAATQPCQTCSAATAEQRQDRQIPTSRTQGLARGPNTGSYKDSTSQTGLPQPASQSEPKGRRRGGAP